MADSSGHIHHYFMCQGFGGGIFDNVLYYLRTDFYGHILTDTVRLNGWPHGAESANELNIAVLGDGQHSWCLFTDIIYGQGNRRGLYLTERDSDGNEIFPARLVRANDYANKAVFRASDSTIHIVGGSSPHFTYNRINTQGDTLIWGRSIPGPVPDTYSSISSLFLAPDGTPWVTAFGGYDTSNYSSVLLIRFAENGIPDTHIFTPDSSLQQWYLLSAGMDRNYNMHLLAKGLDPAQNYYHLLDSSLTMRETDRLNAQNQSGGAMNTDQEGNCFIVTDDFQTLHAGYRLANGSWPMPLTEVTSNLDALDIAISFVSSSRFAFTCTGYRGDNEDLYLFTYGFPAYNESRELPVIARDFLLSACPNPFNSSTRITFELASREHIQLAVFDLQGRLITTLTNAILEAGSHAVMLSGDGLASGVYFVRLQTAKISRTEKILLLK